MLRTTSGLSRPVLKWVSQATASLGATLAATLIWSAIPHPAAPAAAQPELTTGGKFAARVTDAVAYDGLDTMPLPRVAPPAPAPVAFMAEGLHGAAWDGAPLSPSTTDHPARTARPAHAAARGEAHRTPAAATIQRAAVDPLPAAAPEPAGDDDFLTRTVPRILPAIASTARGAWAVTASAGESLVSRVAPRIP